ncbi:MAG: hypothetical protein CMP16_00300 [Rickettsiales bacterium]|mgnify:CR=1 FL=1|nr:hypothetical protein [Rickettsiales bacterium]|tara:strand:+ start:5803 stop:7056 length:1254 start_codon:yes stop_codon:yes gene_type:complete
MAKSEFNKNVFLLASGTVFAQALPIVISPILTRIYTPSDFGTLSLFIAIASIFASIANGRYELAIMLPKNDENAIKLLLLTLIINLSISMSLMLIIIFFHDKIIEYLADINLSNWLYFIPIVVFLQGAFNSFHYFHLRKKRYKSLRNIRIAKSVSLSTPQVFLGLLKQGPFGLIIGEIISSLFSVLYFIKIFFKKTYKKVSFSLNDFSFLAKKYKKFPKYSMWGILSNVLSTQLINILISSIYGLSFLGFYSIVQRTLGVPSTLIGDSIGSVFFQSATEEKKSNGNAIKSFNYTSSRLIIIGIMIFVPLHFLIVDMFRLIFGENWTIAGEYAKILLPLFFMRFVAASLSNINNVFGQQKIAFIWQFMLLILSITSIIISHIYFQDFKTFLKILSGLVSLHYFLLFLIVFRVSYNGKL